MGNNPLKISHKSHYGGFDNKKLNKHIGKCELGDLDAPTKPSDHASQQPQAQVRAGSLPTTSTSNRIPTFNDVAALTASQHARDTATTPPAGFEDSVVHANAGAETEAANESGLTDEQRDAKRKKWEADRPNLTQDQGIDKLKEWATQWEKAGNKFDKTTVGNFANQSYEGVNPIADNERGLEGTEALARRLYAHAMTLKDPVEKQRQIKRAADILVSPPLSPVARKYGFRSEPGRVYKPDLPDIGGDLLPKVSKKGHESASANTSGAKPSDDVDALLDDVIEELTDTPPPTGGANPAATAQQSSGQQPPEAPPIPTQPPPVIPGQQKPKSPATGTGKPQSRRVGAEVSDELTSVLARRKGKSEGDGQWILVRKSDTNKPSPQAAPARPLPKTPAAEPKPQAGDPNTSSQAGLLHALPNGQPDSPHPSPLSLSSSKTAVPGSDVLPVEERDGKFVGTSRQGYEVVMGAIAPSTTFPSTAMGQGPADGELQKRDASPLSNLTVPQGANSPPLGVSSSIASTPTTPNGQTTLSSADPNAKTSDPVVQAIANGGYIPPAPSLPVPKVAAIPPKAPEAPPVVPVQSNAGAPSAESTGNHSALFRQINAGGVKLNPVRVQEKPTELTGMGKLLGRAFEQMPEVDDKKGKGTPLGSDNESNDDEWNETPGELQGGANTAAANSPTDPKPTAGQTPAPNNPPLTTMEDLVAQKKELDESKKLGEAGGEREREAGARPRRHRQAPTAGRPRRTS